MWRPNASGAERPTDVKAVVGKVASRFIGYDQHDAQEFLRFFLDALHEDLNTVRVRPAYVEIKEKPGDSDDAVSELWWRNYCERNDSAVKDIFAGQLKSVVKCKRCGTESRAFDPFWDMSLPIPKRSQVREKRFGGLGGLGRAGGGGDASCTIQDCLREFTEPEVLSGDDAFYCGKCKAHNPCDKLLQLYRCPEVLVLHLKRFSYTTYRRDKLCTDVKFPVSGLDLTPYCADAALKHAGGRDRLHYDLIGVSNHMGGMGGGHYTAHCLNDDTGKWFSFNDSRAAPASEASLSGSAAYMLFYRREA